MASQAIVEAPAFVLPIETPLFARRQSRWDASAQTASLIVDDDLDDDEPRERKLPERRSSLGYSLLLSAVEDYRRAVGKDFESAKRFLFPDCDAGRAQLRWAIDLAGISEYHTRNTLDRLRPRWDADRKTEATS